MEEGRVDTEFRHAKFRKNTKFRFCEIFFQTSHTLNYSIEQIKFKTSTFQLVVQYTNFAVRNLGEISQNLREISYSP
jgi:hypothetical protein